MQIFRWIASEHHFPLRKRWEKRSDSAAWKLTQVTMLQPLIVDAGTLIESAPFPEKNTRPIHLQGFPHLEFLAK